VAEYFLRGNMRDIFSKVEFILSRSYVVLKIIWKSRAYRFIIGRNIEKNTMTLVNFFEESL